MPRKPRKIVPVKKVIPKKIVTEVKFFVLKGVMRGLGIESSNTNMVKAHVEIIRKLRAEGVINSRAEILIDIPKDVSQKTYLWNELFKRGFVPTMDCMDHIVKRGDKLFVNDILGLVTNNIRLKKIDKYELVSKIDLADALVHSEKLSNFLTSLRSSTEDMKLKRAINTALESINFIR